MPFPPYPPSIPRFIRSFREAHGPRELLVLEDRRLGFADADIESARLARGLLARGVGKGTRVGLMMPNGPDWVVALLAVTRIGAVLVPLNTFYQTRELQWILRHADVHTLLTVSRFLSHDYLSRLEDAAPGLAGQAAGDLRLPGLPYLRQVFVWGECDRRWADDGAALLATAGGDERIDAAFLAAVEENVSPADPMAIMYSSGSTAEPKGALHTQGTMVRHSYNLAMSRNIGPGDRIWSPMPFFWVGGLIFSLLGGIHAGVTTICEEVFDPPRTLALLERERVTHALGWPHFGKALAEHPTRKERDLSSLRAGNVPDVLPPEIVSPDIELRANSLGMTETCGPHTWDPTEGPLPESLRGSFGKAVEGVEHRVIDPESGAVLAAGQLGELCIRGYNVMQGLYKMEREEVFEPDGFYRTGDAGYFDASGVLYFKARLGDMIKSGGANVTPSEVEQVMLLMPEIKEAYVVGVDDAERGQSVESAVVPKAGARVDEEEIRRRLKKELSAYKVPRHVFVYEDGELPFTDTGKIDKRRLRALLTGRLREGAGRAS